MKNHLSLLLVWLLWVGLTSVVVVGETWVMLACINAAIAQGGDALVIIVLLPPYLLLISLSVGVIQALLLGFWFQQWKGWVLASGAGVLIWVPIFFYLLSPWLPRSVNAVLSWQTALLLGAVAALVGAVVGFAQARLIGRPRPQRSHWILASALCWGVTWPVSLLGLVKLQWLNLLSPQNPIFGDLAMFGGVWVCLSLTTGCALLLGLPRGEKQAEVSPGT